MPNNEDSQQTDTADIDYEDFMKISWKDASELYSFFTIGVILPASNCLRFRKNLLDPL